MLAWWRLCMHGICQAASCLVATDWLAATGAPCCVACVYVSYKLISLCAVVCVFFVVGLCANFAVVDTVFATIHIHKHVYAPYMYIYCII